MVIFAAYDTVGSHNMKPLMIEKAEKFCGKKKPVFQVSKIFAVIFLPFKTSHIQCSDFVFLFYTYSLVSLFTVHPELLDWKERERLIISLEISRCP